MRALRVLIVDDEEPARDRLRRMLEAIGGVEVAAEASDGGEALARIEAERPDLVFLDIEMPGLSGIEVAKRLTPPRPRTVFCTAYDRYAVAAFDEDAADYLLKPVSQPRLVRTVERVRRTVDEDDRLRQEVADASRAQARLFPDHAPVMRSLELAGRCIPAREVGGDYYDFLGLGGGRIGMALGDVCGKGLYAGLLMAGLQARVQSLAPHHGSQLAELVRELNRSLYSSVESHRYATLFYGVYDESKGELSYVNAGHLPPIVVRAGAAAQLETLAASGTVIGLLPDGSWQQRTTTLAPGDLFCAFTDGVTEAADAEGVEFGAARLSELLSRLGGTPAASVCDAVLAAVEGFSAHAPASDDRTVIVARAR